MGVRSMMRRERWQHLTSAAQALALHAFAGN
jgi:hypothetical protein